MDNVCIFNDWKLSNLKFSGEGAKRRAELTMTTRKPNIAGVWNKNYFTAFGKRCEDLEKLQVQKGAIITVTAEQQAYIDKNGAMRNNYLVLNFEIVTYGKEEAPKNNNSPATVPLAAAEKPTAPQMDIMEGFNNMMSYMD